MEPQGLTSRYYGLELELFRLRREMAGGAAAAG
jgi:hypothetical protein